MSPVLPIFSSCYSIGRSILTLDKPSKESWPNVVSIFDIAKKYKLEKVYIADNSMGGFYHAYNNGKANGVQVNFGVIINVVNSLVDFDKATSSQVIVWLSNGEAYEDINKIVQFSQSLGYRMDKNAKGEDLKYGYPFIDWKTLNEMFTSNLSLSIPFYSGFIAHNIFTFGHFSNPDFDKVRPVFFLNSQSLPFDPIIRNNTVKYCESNGYEMVNARHIYYYERSNATSLLTMRAILNRGSLEKPECANFGSDDFCFIDKDESKVKTDKEIEEITHTRLFNYI